MIEWMPFFVAVIAAVVSYLSQQIALTVAGYFCVLTVTLWRFGGPVPVEPLAAALVVLAVASTVPPRAGRFWLGIALAGIAWPGEGVASLPGLSLTAIGTCGSVIVGADVDGRIAASRFGVLALVWVAAMTLVELAVPDGATSGAVDALASSRARLPMMIALACGMSCWPVHTFALYAGKRGAMGGAAVVPLLGLETMARLDLSNMIRSSVIGDSIVVFLVLGLFTLCVGAMLSLAHEDIRFRLVAAQIGLAAWAATIWIESPTAARVFWATASVATAVAGAVINRLEFRYRSRERNSFSGLATRHPTAAVTLGFSGIVSAKVAVGSVAMTVGLPAIASIDPLLVAIVLVAGLVYAAAFGDVMREMLFGSPRVPEFSGEIFERVGKIGRNPGALVGPTTLFAWGVPLLFVIVTGVAPYNLLQSIDAAESLPIDVPVEPTIEPIQTNPLPIEKLTPGELPAGE